MAIEGTVREWHDGDGWGVVDSPATPGGCWVHCSAVLVAGYRSLDVGQRVLMEVEAADQDGWQWSAVRAWPVGQEPVEPRAESEGTGFGSRVTISFDD